MSVRLLPPRHVRAIREDAIGGGAADASRVRIGVRRLYIGPHRVRIRIGDEPVRDVAHMASEDFYRSLDLQKITLRRRPRCRACGGLIGHGERAIAFTRFSSERARSGVTAYLHEECPS